MIMKESKFKIYNNIVSFGCMCSTALYLKKIGVRSKSCFFDWITSDIKNNLLLVNNKFDDFFNKTYFRQDYKGYSHLVTNTKYNFVYSHVFDSKKTLAKQYNSVKKRVQKSIDNFLLSLNDSCLLVYYSRSEVENKWIVDNQESIKDFCKTYGCDIIFVLNFEIDVDFAFPTFVIPQNNVHIPNGGGVSFPFTNTEALDAYLIEHYPIDKLQKNLRHPKKEHKSIFKSAFHRLSMLKRDKLKI